MIFEKEVKRAVPLAATKGVLGEQRTIAVIQDTKIHDTRDDIDEPVV